MGTVQKVRKRNDDKIRKYIELYISYLSFKSGEEKSWRESQHAAKNAMSHVVIFQ